MEKKIVFFAFTGHKTCFVHVLLNGLDMQRRGYLVKIVIEGAATRLIREFAEPDKPFASLFAKVREAGLIAGVCRACAKTMKSLPDVEAQGLPLLDDMSGHPAMEPYIEQGYQVITL